MVTIGWIILIILVMIGVGVMAWWLLRSPPTTQPPSLSSAQCLPLAPFFALTVEPILIPAINDLDYRLDYEAEGIWIKSSGPIQLEKVTFIPDQSELCGSTIRLGANVELSVNGVEMMLFAPEDVGRIEVDAEMNLTFELAGAEAGLTNLGISRIVVSTPNHPAIAELVNLFDRPLTAAINAALKNVRFRVPYRPQLYAPNPEVVAFIQRQLDGLLRSPLIRNQTFKVCDNCPTSTLSQINLGKTVWSEDDGCAGVRILGHCVGCSWVYRVGLNSIRGMDTLRLKSLAFGNVYRQQDFIRFPFTFVLEAPDAAIYGTARVQPCIGGTEFGPNNIRVGVPGTPSMTVTGYLEGAISGGPDERGRVPVVFRPRDIILREVKIRTDIDMNWARDAVRTGNKIADAIIGPIIDALLFPVHATVSVFQLLLNSLLKDYLNPVVQRILSNIIQNLSGPGLEINIPLP